VSTALYPVLEERRLAPVQRKFAARNRRDLAELPPSPPGTALVFQAGGRFVVFNEQRHLDGTEDFVLGALAVAVVNMRTQRIVADLELPSKHPAELFTVKVTFEATVTQADVVVRQGAMDLAKSLKDHLLRDPKLAGICASSEIEQITDVREKLDARIRAYSSIRAFQTAGIAVTLELVEVLTPNELRERNRRDRSVEIDSDHQKRVSELEHRNKLLIQEQEQEMHARELELDRRLREREAQLERAFETRAALHEQRQTEERTSWEQQQRLLTQQHEQLVREKERAAEDAEARWAEGFVKGGVPALLAWASARGLITPLQLAQMQRNDERHTIEQIKDVLVELNREGRGDMVSFDMQILVDNLLEKLTGMSPLGSSNDALATGGTRSDQPSIEARQDGDPDQTPPDENDFLD
jgi:hypothetical protein